MPEVASRFDPKECLANWRLGTDTRANQSKREVEDLSLQVPENIWDPAARADRASGLIGGVAIPQRPCLSIPKQNQPLNIVRNQMQNAHMGIAIRPINAEADDDTAEVKQDLYRSIERDPDAPASHARNWGFDRALQCGTGWYRVNTVYDETSDSEWDQKILIETILYQDAVIIDPSATKPDYSDAQWGMITYWVPWDKFKREYPTSSWSVKAETSKEIGFDVNQLDTITPGWVQQNGESKSIQVAEYFCKHYENQEKVSPDGKQKRTYRKVRVMRYLVGPGDEGVEAIEENLWNGPDIPLIPVIGQRLQPFDSEMYIYGMIRPMRDPLKVYSYAATALTERTALEPKAPFMADPEQIDDYKQVWNQANTRAFPYLPYKSISRDGHMVPAPHRTEVNTSTLSPAMLLLQQSDEMIQDTSSTPNPVLGKARRDQSGRAISALQNQSELSTSGFLQNFADITLRYEAKVVLGMMKNVYDRPGRIAQVMNIHNEVRRVMLNAPFIMDPNGRPIQTDTNGKPMVPTPTSSTFPPMGGPGTTSGGAPMGQHGPMKPPPKPKLYDLSKGAYGVTISIEKSKQSQLEEGSEQLATFIEKDPELASVLAPIYLEFQSWPGAKQAAEVAKRYVERKFSGLYTSKDGEKTPEQLEGELKSAQAQIQQMQQAGAELQKQLETKQIENQAKIAAEQVKGQVAMAEAQQKGAEAEKLAQIQAAVDVELERMREQNALELQSMKAAAESERQRQQQEFDARMAAFEAAQADKMAAKQAEQAENSENREDMRAATAESAEA